MRLQQAADMAPDDRTSPSMASAVQGGTAGTTARTALADGASATPEQARRRPTMRRIGSGGHDPQPFRTLPFMTQSPLK